MTSTLALAVRLGELDDAELSTLITSRGVNPANIDDFFDLAEALLTAGNIQTALSKLDRVALAAIAAIAAGDTTTLDAGGRAQLEPLSDLLLLDRTDDGYTAYDAVRERLAAWPDDGLPSARQLNETPPPTGLAAVPLTEARFVEQLAAEHAFAAVGAVTELISALAAEPARELQKGGLALPDTRRIAAAAGIADERTATLLWCAEHAGLAARDGSSWLPAESAGDWAKAATAEKWAALASGWLHDLPDDIRRLLASRARANWDESLRAYASWLYPAAGPELRTRLDAFAAAADFLGITVANSPSAAGAALLEAGVEPAAFRIAELFPAEVDRAYLQHDLTIVSAGPLAPAVDSRLRTMADVESRALAASYRVSTASITRAIAAGESAASIREFLEQVSLTGIPQPLDYLIAETASRYGRVRVASIAESASAADSHGVRSRVHSADTALLDAIAIDQNLTPLALVREANNELAGRFERDVVFWALSDARYPVAAEDNSGRIVSLQRRRLAAPARHRADDPVLELVQRLRAAAAADADETAEAWMSRQLDIAIKAKSTLAVSVVLPDGSIAEYLLEPTGVAGGRLRGRDRTADIERTLPLSSIRDIRTQ